MAKEVRIKNTGLRGVAVADTKISYIDGQQGILIYRGYRIEELAARSSFVETAYLLLNGTLPRAEQLAAFEAELSAARELPLFMLNGLGQWPRTADPMDVLQAGVPLLAMADPERTIESRDANVRKALRVIARMPALIAAWHRIRSGHDPLPPNSALPHAANFLWQLTGAVPDEEMVRALDVSLLLQSEHTFNASTFACREVVSTRAHLYAGVTAGVGALSGDLHGGANARVMETVLQMEAAGKTAGDAAQWVRERLDRGERIMGMGHAVYKTFDPRAGILKEMVERLSHKTGRENWLRLLLAIEETCLSEFERRGKGAIKPNVDFYSGLLYACMGIPVDLMTPVFAMALAVGWCAHIIEEKFAEAQEKPVLYRPEADYVGHYCGALGCDYQPIEQR